MLENAVENIGILEKSGVSDYTLFGSIISERSWSLPDACNTYTSLYFDKPLDLDFSDGCGTWTKFGRSSVNIYCYSNYGYMTLTSNGDNSGVYTEILTEIDSTYVLTIDITSLTQYTSWAVYVRDDQSNIIASTTISQTGEINFDFTATSTTTRIEILRISGFGTSSISITQLSVIGKYHKEDVMYLSYRYGFNNMEKDDELKGHGNSYDFGARIYDPRVGSWLAVDPWFSKFPTWSPYNSFNNNPIVCTDPNGKGGIPKIIIDENGKPIIIVYSTIYVYTDNQSIDPKQAANNIKNDIESELNYQDYTRKIRYFKDENSRNYNTLTAPIKFNINAIGVDSYAKVLMLAGINDHKKDLSVNFIYVHDQDAVVGFNTARGGNSSIININSIAKTKAHEHLHTLGFCILNSYYEYIATGSDSRSRSGSHFSGEGEENRLMYEAPIEKWKETSRASQADISRINFGQILTEGKEFGWPISNAIYNSSSLKSSDGKVTPINDKPETMY